MASTELTNAFPFIPTNFPIMNAFHVRALPWLGQHNTGVLLLRPWGSLFIFLWFGLYLVFSLSGQGSVVEHSAVYLSLHPSQAPLAVAVSQTPFVSECEEHCPGVCGVPLYLSFSDIVLITSVVLGFVNDYRGEVVP